ncbi:MAG: efflux RND transporter permease subunit [Bdellovibrionales bacterium]|nr:efflux RND transporter permease subunit [Bdellovibrionales bacterium]
MDLANLSIKRPTFITAIIFLMLAVGYTSMKKLGVDIFPNITFPVVTVTTPYPGAGPSEIETLVSKPLEDEISTLSGIKRLSSINQEGVSILVAEFTLETDVKFAEQQIRDRVSSTKRKLPLDVKESTIRRIDPADQPIMVMALRADLKQAELFDMASEVIKPRLEQVNQVGLVDVIGGRKREIRVELDRNKLKQREISAGQVAARLAAAGENIPVGKIEKGEGETVFRTVGQFKSVKDIEATIVNFFGSDVPTTVSDVGKVVDSLVDERSQTYVNGEKSLLVNVFRQSGSNTVAVAEALKKRIDKINEEIANLPGKPKLEMVRDSSVWVKMNVEDVKESITFGIILAVLVVFYFLGSGRSTLITGLALPNSLIGAFILMAAAGFTINIMTLLALSLSVGLLIDDAIVVRENIFRHIEMGKPPIKAAIEGTGEVRLAVIATTLTVIAVFGPVGFLKGVVGQFFKEFGLTICFAMIISLFDALTIAPMLSAYFAGNMHGSKTGKENLWDKTIGRSLKAFNRFQEGLEDRYENLIRYTVKNPKTVLGASFLIFLGSCAAVVAVPKTFLPPQDAGEFSIGLDLPPGTNLNAMSETARKIDQVVRAHKEVLLTSLTIGNRDGEPNVADIYVKLVPSKERKVNTSQMKEVLRDELKNPDYARANPKVKDFDAVGGGQRPFNLAIVAQDQAALEKIATQAFDKLKNHPAFKDVDINFRPGKPELQVVPENRKMELLGISSVSLGQELRTQIEGITPAKFRENGIEYDVRVRVKEDQRNLKDDFQSIYVPNINNNLVRLADVTKAVETTGPAKINRMDRGRYIQVSADMNPKGPGMGEVMTDIRKMFETDLKLPQGMRYMFVGQAENFQELAESMALAMGFGVLFIFLVLASLYESFVTPFTIMLALPLAICGSFLALLVTGESLNIFSMIGTIMLLGVATKNSILLVDYANQLVAEGMSRAEALAKSGRTRLRPILMTTMALIAGTLPVALGLNEASKQRTSMGVAIIGGLISSTLLTLVVVPAAYTFIDRFRIWSKAKMMKLFGTNSAEESHRGNGKSHGSEKTINA